MHLLAIDTSSNLLSIALFKDQQVLGYENEISQMQHGVLLIPKIEALLDAHQLTPIDVDGIIIGMGPGSYTGLRIGVTAAKMWGISRAIPVYPVSSLAVMARSVEVKQERTAIVPIVDARRLSAYTAIYQYQLAQQLTPILADTHADWKTWLSENQSTLTSYNQVVFVGYQIAEFEATVKEVLPTLSYQWVDQIEALPQMERSLDLISQPVVNLNLLSPNYAQVTLAEREWVQKQEQVQSDEELVDTTIN